MANEVKIRIGVDGAEDSGSRIARVTSALDKVSSSAASVAAKSAAAFNGQIASAAQAEADRVEAAFRALGVRSSAVVAQEARQLREALKGLTAAGLPTADLDRATSALRTRFAELRAELGRSAGAAPLQGIGQGADAAGASVDRLSDKIKLMGHIGAAITIGPMLVDSVRAAVSSLSDAQVASQKLSASLEYSSGSAKGAAAEIRYLDEVSNRLGLNFASASDAYAKFAASARSAGLSAETTKEVFEGVAKASVRFGLSAEETNGALLALSQMAGRGVVSMEELRGQLGERLPGAFALAAKAMGVSQQEMIKLVESGKLMASDFLPRFAQALNENITAPLNTLGQEINRTASAWEQWKRQMSDGAGGGMSWITEGLRESTAAMRALGKEAGITYRAFYGLGAFVSGGMLGKGYFDYTTIQQRKLSEYRSANSEIGGLESRKYLNPQEREYLNNLKRDRDALRADLDQLAEKIGREQAQMPDLAANFAAQQQKRTDAFTAYMASVRDQKQKEIDTEKASFAQLTAVIGTSGKQYEDALAAHKKKIADINKSNGSGSKNDLQQALNERLSLVKDAGAQEIALIKERVKAGELTEYEGIRATAEAQKKNYADIYEAQQKLLAATTDQGDRARVMGEMSKTVMAWSAVEQRAAYDVAAAWNKTADAFLGSANKENATLDRAIEKAREELEAIGMTAEQKDLLRQKSYDLAAQQAEETAEVYRLAAAYAEANQNAEGASFYAAAQATAEARAAKLRELAVIESQQSARRVAVKAADDSKKAWENFARDIEQSLTDSLYRAFESGQSFGEAFANSLKNTFKTMVLKVAVQAVVSTGGSLVNAGINALLGTSGSNGGAGNNYLGLANNAQSAYSLYGLAANTYQYGAADTAKGMYYAAQNFFSPGAAASEYTVMTAAELAAAQSTGLYASTSLASVAPGVSPVVAQMASGGGSAAAAAPAGSTAGAMASMWPLAVVAGMYMSSKLYDSGYKFENDTVKADDPKTWSLLAQAGMYNEANMVGKLFGQDNFGDSKIWQVLSGANLSRYVDEYVQKALGIRGGGPKMEAFGGDRTVSWGLAQTAPGNEVLSGIATGLETQFNSILETFGKSAQDIMVGLGMDADPNGDAGARTGYALKVGDQSIISERGVDSLTMEAIQNNANRALIAALQAVDISQPVNAYLDSLGDIGKLTKDQISTALGMIDTYHGLNKAMADLNLGADSLTTGLLNAFGGVQGLQTALASYYDNYFTTEEKRARTVSQITSALNAAGATFTDAQIGSMDRADYRAWLESIPAANEALRAAALQASASFAAITDSADQAAASLKQSAADIAASAIAAAQKNIDALRTIDTSSLDSAMSAVERAIDAEKTAAQAQLDAASERAAAIGQLTDVLKQSIDDIYGTATSTAASQVAQAQAFIDRSLQTASRTGYLPDADALSQAIQTVRSSQTADAYASNFEFQRAQLVLAGQLGGLQDIAKPQLSAAEHAVQLAQDQLDALDQQLKAAQDQVDALRGVDTSVLSVAAAVAGLQTALATEQAARDIATATPETATIRDQVSALYDIMLNRQADQTGLDYWTAQATAAGSLASIIDLFRQAALANGEVPAFASGTAFVPRDMRADIHQGEIIIDPASSNVLRRYGIGVTSGGDGGATQNEISALREEQRAQSAAFAGYMARLAKVVEKWDAEGMPEVAV